MGAAYQETIIHAKNKGEFFEAYGKYFKQECWEHGHSGYSGTFAEKPEVEIRPGTWDRYGAEEDAEEYNDKWGPAWAYNLGDGTYYVGGWCSS